MIVCHTKKNIKPYRCTRQPIRLLLILFLLPGGVDDLYHVENLVSGASHEYPFVISVSNDGSVGDGQPDGQNSVGGQIVYGQAGSESGTLAPAKSLKRFFEQGHLLPPFLRLRNN